MTRDRWKDKPDAWMEVDRFHLFVGRYVLAYQEMESKLEELILLSESLGDFSATQAKLAAMSNFEKIEQFGKMVTVGGRFARIPTPGWYTQFDDVVDRLHKERRHRNGILHSHYLFDFLAIGRPIFRTDAKKIAGEIELTQEPLTVDRCNEILNRLNNLRRDLGFICQQLRFAFDADW